MYASLHASMTCQEAESAHTQPCEFRGSVGRWCSELLSQLLCGHAGYQKETGFFSIGLGSEPCCLWPTKQGFCYTLPLIEKNHRAYRTNRRLNVSGEIVWLRWINYCICCQTSFVLVLLLFFSSLRKYTPRMDCEHLCSKFVTKNSSVNKRCKKKALIERRIVGIWRLQGLLNTHERLLLEKGLSFIFRVPLSGCLRADPTFPVFCPFLFTQGLEESANQKALFFHPSPAFVGISSLCSKSWAAAERWHTTRD